METIAAPRMVPGYRHQPGNHCGSTALRNLLAHHGVEVTEEMALGLGAGVSFYYVPMDGQSPSRFTNGRVGRLEEQFVELTGAPIRLDTFDGPEASWKAAREAVDAGRSAILLMAQARLRLRPCRWAIWPSVGSETSAGMNRHQGSSRANPGKNADSHSLSSAGSSRRDISSASQSPAERKSDPDGSYRAG